MDMAMEHSLSAMDAIVLVAVAIALLFFLAWALSPRLRVWIEQPKYRFQEAIERYDHRQKETLK